MRSKIIGLIAAGSSATVFSECDQQIGDLTARVAALELQAMQPRELCEKDLGIGLTLFVSPLYWKSKLTEQAIGIDSSASVLDVTSADFPFSQEPLYHTMKWDWGVRVGAGYEFSRDCWDIEAEYTHYKTSGSQNVQYTIGESGRIQVDQLYPSVYPNLVPNLYTSEVLGVQSSLDIDLNELSLDLGKSCDMSPYFVITARGGLSGIMIDQTVNTNWNGLTYSDGVGVISENQIEENGVNNFSGIGPLLGLGMKWKFPLGFSMIADLQGTLYFSRIHHTQIYTMNGLYTVNYHATNYQYVPACRGVIGINYDAYFNDGAQHFGLGIGWELQYIWNIIGNYEYGKSPGDFGVSGLTIQVFYGF